MTEAVGQASAKFVAGLWSRINSLVLVIRGYRIRGDINRARAEETRIRSTEKNWEVQRDELDVLSSLHPKIPGLDNSA